VSEYLDSIDKLWKYQMHPTKQIRNKETGLMEYMPVPIVIEPGYNMIKKTTFKLNNTELPYRDGNRGSQ
jgi:hypothetical protein